MLYRLADHGLVFSTRDRGARMLADLRETAGASTATIDFADVRSLSYSFVDEFVGQLIQDAFASGDLPTLVNLPPAVARTIERSLRRRGLDPALALEQTLEVA
jgi:anti-anti-sigma regulatory factor